MQESIALADAINILTTAKISVFSLRPIWDKPYRAQKYLENQLQESMDRELAA